MAVYQVLQDLRLDIAVSNGWNEDEVSWERLTRNIGIYTFYPRPATHCGAGL